MLVLLDFRAIVLVILIGAELFCDIELFGTWVLKRMWFHQIVNEMGFWVLSERMHVLGYLRSAWILQFWHSFWSFV